MKTILKKIIAYILKVEAQLVLRKYKPKIIAVTGSVGKTSTKDAIFSVLSETMHIRKSNKSFNSEIGLPLTILGCPNAWSNPLRWLQNILDGLYLIIISSPYPEWLVLEVGADRPGDISSLASWLKVDVAVITRLPDVPVHVEFFDSPEKVIEEKASLINALTKEGTLIVFADDEKMEKLKEKAAQKGAKVISYGFSGTADVHIQHMQPLFASDTATNTSYPIGMQASLVSEGGTHPISITGVFGTHSLLPSIAAAAVGRVLEVSWEEIEKGITSFVPPPGRMRLVPGIKHTCIIDDTYNSSPAAVEAALHAITLLSGRKIAVLGDMLELGKYSAAEHKKIGPIAAKCIDVLITVGLRSRDIAESALSNGMTDANIFQFEDSLQAANELPTMVREGDTILVKGSQSTRSEKVVEALMLEPEKAIELLVRQEADWKKR